MRMVMWVVAGALASALGLSLIGTALPGTAAAQSGVDTAIVVTLDDAQAEFSWTMDAPPGCAPAPIGGLVTGNLNLGVSSTGFGDVDCQYEITLLKTAASSHCAGATVRVLPNEIVRVAVGCFGSPTLAPLPDGTVAIGAVEVLATATAQAAEATATAQAEATATAQALTATPDGTTTPEPGAENPVDPATTPEPGAENPVDPATTPEPPTLTPTRVPEPSPTETPDEVLGTAAAPDDQAQTPEPTATEAPEPTPTRSPTPAPTPEPTPTRSPTPVPTPEPTRVPEFGATDESAGPPLAAPSQGGWRPSVGLGLVLVAAGFSIAGGAVMTSPHRGGYRGRWYRFTMDLRNTWYRNRLHRWYIIRRNRWHRRRGGRRFME